MRHRVPFLPGLVLAVVLAGCSPAAPAADAPPAADAAGAAGPAQAFARPDAWETLAILKTGEYPLWFELGAGGPRLIHSPAEASLSPYVPWPQARYAAGVMDWKGRIVLVVNREGFLIIEAGEKGEACLRRAADSGLWDPYTAAPPFLLNGKPGVLLYRNDFFSETPAPPPNPRVFTLDEGKAAPFGIDPPALAVFPAPLWEVDSLKPVSNGFWYYRAAPSPATQDPGNRAGRYYRSADLSLPGEEISVGLWRNSLLPEPPENAPALLAGLLDRAFALSAGPAAASVISAEFSGPRIFSAPGSGEGENLSLLSGYYRETPALALVLFSGGRVLAEQKPEAASPPKEELRRFSFSLPALPDGFSYTGIGLAGDVLAASWEEQQDSAIGAAGFMVLNTAALLPAYR